MKGAGGSIKNMWWREPRHSWAGWEMTCWHGAQAGRPIVASHGCSYQSILPKKQSDFAQVATVIAAFRDGRVSLTTCPAVDPEEFGQAASYSAAAHATATLTIALPTSSSRINTRRRLISIVPSMFKDRLKDSP